MKSLAKLSASQILRFSRLHLHASKQLYHYTHSLWPATRRMLALLMALLLPMWQAELFAQQQAAPLQLGQPQQDYSSQIQSDDPNYPAQQDHPAADAQQQGQPFVQPLGPDRLQQLVAPIALYPDTLVALVLTAATYPAQVQDADQWRQAQGNAPAEQIAAGANGQIWDPSVKALTAFPQVLAEMDQNLAWTTDLGTAYFNQSTDVLEAVQVMRARAQAAGNLQPTLQEAVNYVGGNIQLAPVNPQVVYVPAYNPWVVYGQPIAPYPGFSLVAALGSFFSSAIGPALIHWGPGIAVSAFTAMPWGLVAWGVSWLIQAILFHNNNYYSHSTTVADWGFPHGGWRAASGGFAGGVNSYSRIPRGYSAPGYGSVHQPPNSYNYARGGYSTGPGNAFVHRPPSSAQGFVSHPYNYARSGSGYSAAGGRGSVPGPSNGYSGYRPAQASNNRGYQGFGYARGAQQSRVSPSVQRPSINDRALSARIQRPSFVQGSSAQYGSRGYAGSYEKQARSSGFHPFGGGHGSQSFHGGTAPKMKAPKNYGGGGHSGGAGHSGGHSSGGGKHHH